MLRVGAECGLPGAGSDREGADAAFPTPRILTGSADPVESGSCRAMKSPGWSVLPMDATATRVKKALADLGIRDLNEYMIIDPSMIRAR